MSGIQLLDLARQARRGGSFALHLESGGTGRADGRAWGLVLKCSGRSSISQYGAVKADYRVGGTGQYLLVEAVSSAAHTPIGIALEAPPGDYQPLDVLVFGVGQALVTGPITPGQLLYPAASGRLTATVAAVAAGIALEPVSGATNATIWMLVDPSAGDRMSPIEFDAKGDILAGTANDTFDNLPVGADGAALIAASAQATGLKWRKHNMTSSVAPTVTADSAGGYEVGSLWYDTTGDRAYTALDVTVGAAVWKEITAAPTAGTVIVEEEDGSPTNDFDTIKFPNGSVTDNGDGSASVSVGSGGGITLHGTKIQEAGYTGNASPQNIVLGAAPTNGNIIYLIVILSGSTVAMTPTQTGVTWTSLLAYTTGGERIQLWKGEVGAGASATLTITRASGTNFWAAQAMEYSGTAGTLTASDVQQASNSTAHGTNGIMPSAAHLIFYAAAGDGGGTAYTITNFLVLRASNYFVIGYRPGHMADFPISGSGVAGTTNWSAMTAAVT